MRSLHNYLWANPTIEGLTTFFHTHYIQFYNSLDDIKPNVTQEYLKQTQTPVTVDYITTVEKEVSLKAIKKGLTDYKEKDVNYTINNWGLRESKYDIKNIQLDLAAFGCSFTFGVGLPLQDTWPCITGNMLNWSYGNFALPGSSTSKIVRTFEAYAEVNPPKTAIVLFPSFGREELILQQRNGEYGIYEYIPNHTPTYDQVINLHKSYQKSIDFNFQEALAIKNFKLIKYIAAHHNIQLYVSSWDPETYKIVQESFDSKQVLPKYDFVSRNPPYARDGSHPPRSANEKFATEIANLYKLI